MNHDARRRIRVEQRCRDCHTESYCTDCHEKAVRIGKADLIATA